MNQHVCLSLTLPAPCLNTASKHLLFTAIAWPETPASQLTANWSSGEGCAACDRMANWRAWTVMRGVKLNFVLVKVFEPALKEGLSSRPLFRTLAYVWEKIGKLAFFPQRIIPIGKTYLSCHALPIYNLYAHLKSLGQLSTGTSPRISVSTKLEALSYVEHSLSCSRFAVDCGGTLTVGSTKLIITIIQFNYITFNVFNPHCPCDIGHVKLSLQSISRLQKLTIHK